MKDIYFIDEPAAISFSGGRTSAYMLHRILEAHGGALPDYIKVVFANTGKEMPQTLDFVERCAQEWGVDITWLELGEYKKVGEYKTGPKTGKPRFRAVTDIVNYESAARNGEPFARLVKNRKYLPNVVTRFCTSELKVLRIYDYLNDISTDEWTQLIGIRADEPRRVAKIKSRKESNHEMYMPLYVDGITKEDIYDFWKAQSFDLELPNDNGTTDWGNCDLCFLKGYRKKMSIIRERPELADWWNEQEESSVARFCSDQPSYADMQLIATTQPSLFNFNDDETIPCFCGD